MFTDMVGYTALMQENELKARADRDRHRQIMEKMIPENGGTIQQYFGDGTMSTFGSAVEGLRCAMYIQKAFQLDPIIPVRIGLHIGDIVYEKDGIYGDAVNVAARIESISQPGCVLFSDRVFDEIKNHPEFTVTSMGQFQFKNVKRDIEVHALSSTDIAFPDQRKLKNRSAGRIKKVAVLPFVNMSSDPENEYFSDGITEELIDAFTKVKGLQVIARTSSFAYKGKNIDIRDIGSQLEVDTILEGSVRKAGNRVRITAQLIDSADGKHMFSVSYNRDLEDIFAVQDEIAQKIAERLTQQLDGVSGIKSTESLVTSPTDNLDAYNKYLKGIFFWKKGTPEGIKKAIELFKAAVGIDPGFALAYSWLANCYVFLGSRGTLLPEISFGKAREYAHQAISLDDGLYDSHLAMAMVKMYHDWDFSNAEISIRKALQLNPGAGDAHYIYSMYLLSVGRTDEALKEAKLSVQLDPLCQPILNNLAYTYLCLRKPDESIQLTERILEIDPNNRSALELKGMNHFLKGDIEKSIQVLTQYRDLVGIEGKGISSLAYVYAKSGRIEDAKRCLGKLIERQNRYQDETLVMDFCIIYAGLGEFDRAFTYLEEAIEQRLGGIFFLNSSPIGQALKMDPKYKLLMKQTGLTIT